MGKKHKLKSFNAELEIDSTRLKCQLELSHTTLNDNNNSNNNTDTIRILINCPPAQTWYPSTDRPSVLWGAWPVIERMFAYILLYKHIKCCRWWMECYKNYQTDGPGTHGLFTSVYSMQLFHQRRMGWRIIVFVPLREAETNAAAAGEKEKWNSETYKGQTINTA